MGRPHRIVDDLVEYVPHVKIEILRADGQVNEIVSVIEKTAHTGNKGDGKIYVCEVDAGRSGPHRRVGKGRCIGPGALPWTSLIGPV